ncbi:MarR family winged helix-turn-helix transcriptional regulator [Paraoerskovia marina]|uniref:DNA-binding transcriptional regulator, MarR family n=1 Tax=Paraoerskovia marina TaxID=545619 RepID=A0A1H1S450_9CELL|nr:MarR family winged helix-turn-helix transcriptional regulator [Paraoerskovia marina]SDS42683.1 DNA-binding transcriptional regulator, MarR family [Paraoerskovia marina]
MPTATAGRDTMDSGTTGNGPMETWPTGRLLSHVTRRVEREWNAHLAGWSLNHASFPVLMHLLRGTMSQRELAERNGVTEQTMSRIVDRLDRHGHVTRELDPADHRRRVVTITPAGRTAAFAAAEPRASDRISSRGLDTEQIAALRGLLIQMATVDTRDEDGEER